VTRIPNENYTAQKAGLRLLKDSIPDSFVVENDIYILLSRSHFLQAPVSFSAMDIFNPSDSLSVTHLAKISLSGRQIGMTENHLTHDFQGSAGS
jgi:hypothetical protein